MKKKAQKEPLVWIPLEIPARELEFLEQVEKGQKLLISIMGIPKKRI